MLIGSCASYCVGLAVDGDLFVTASHNVSVCSWLLLHSVSTANAKKSGDRRGGRAIAATN